MRVIIYEIVITLLMLLSFAVMTLAQPMLEFIEHPTRVGVYNSGPETTEIKYNCDPWSQHVMTKNLVYPGDTTWFSNVGRLNITSGTYWFKSSPYEVLGNIIYEGIDAPKLTIEDYSDAGEIHLECNTNAYKTSILVLHPAYGMVHYQVTTQQNFNVQKQLQVLPPSSYLVIFRSFYQGQCKDSFTMKYWIHP